MEETINRQYQHKYYIGKSDIGTHGLFAREPIQAHHPICVGIYFIYYFIPTITHALYFINNKKEANTKLVYFNNKYFVVATKNIQKKEQIVLDYDDKKNNPWYLQARLGWYNKPELKIFLE